MIIYIKWFYIFSLVLFFIILNFTSRSTWHRLCVCLYCLNCYASYVFIYVQYYIVFSYMLSFVFRQNPFYRRVTPRLNRSSSLSSMAFLQQIPSTSSTSFLFGRAIRNLLCRRRDIALKNPMCESFFDDDILLVDDNNL